MKLTVDPGRISEVAGRIEAYRPWYHKIDLGSGLTTRFADDVFDERYDSSATRKHAHLSRDLPLDLAGQSVLDIGCCSGLFSLLALEREAASVVGIDDKLEFVRQANYLIRDALGAKKFKAHEESIYTYQRRQPFDHVVFYGVLYHLLDPFYALFRIRNLTSKALYLHTYISDSAGDNYMSELLYTPHLKAYNNWRHGIQVVRAMLDYVGFDILREEVETGQVFLVAAPRPGYEPPKYRWAT